MRSRWLRALGLVLGLLLLALVWMFWPVRLPVAELPADLSLPPASPPASMSLHALPTARIASRALLAFRGGGFQARDFSMTAYLVRHPRGDLLIDAGMGSAAEAHLAAQSWLMRLTTELSLGTPVATQLRAAGHDPADLAGVLLTHAHWDHVSGLVDMAQVPVWLPGEEVEFVDADEAMTALARQVIARRHPYQFSDQAYLGYPRSYDVWGDGSVVIVPSPGHTPGSVVIFVTLPDGQRYGFVGDIVWQREGLDRPAERPWISRLLVDADAARVRAAVSHLAALQRRYPDLILVPAHDDRDMQRLPPLRH